DPCQQSLESNALLQTLDADVLQHSRVSQARQEALSESDGCYATLRARHSQWPSRSAAVPFDGDDNAAVWRPREAPPARQVPGGVPASPPFGSAPGRFRSKPRRRSNGLVS